MLSPQTLNNQLCFAIYEAGNELQKLYSKALSPYSLTYPQYLVLLSLWEHNGVTVKELGEQLSLGNGTLTPMLKRMESHGWLRKERSTEDERKVYIRLEDKAWELQQEILESIQYQLSLCSIFEKDIVLMNKLHELTLQIRTKGAK
ncbi:Organic hydroperoxide resistance transcriptional regulator [compost metagenome]